MLEVYIDGLAKPSNPGVGTYGFVVYSDGKKLIEGHGPAGENVTNNFAEYVAVVRALSSIVSNADKPVVVKSDSKLLVSQMRGEWKVKKGAYLPKYREAKELARRFKSLKFVWVPRERNTEADELSRLAYAQLTERGRPKG